MELKITQEENRFFLEGTINEFANFQPLFEFEGPELIVNWKNVARINSTGVREWINALEKLNQNTKVRFEECPIIVVYQMNMIPNFSSQVKVDSVYAPYFCEECGNQEDILISTKEFKPGDDVPEFPCSSCENPTMVFDDEEDSYFYFLELTQ